MPVRKNKTSSARSSTKHPFRVGRSNTGLGLFATEPIKKGARIVEYVGKIVPTKKADDINSKYLFTVNSRWTIDGAPRRNVARYANHSCRPNAESDIVRGRVFIDAKKNIAPGEEITYNYGEEYFDGIIKPMGCRCAKCLDEKTTRRAAATKKQATKRQAAGKTKAKVTKAKATKTEVTKAKVTKTKATKTKPTTAKAAKTKKTKTKTTKSAKRG